MTEPLVAGNWKMNGLRSAIAEVETISEALSRSKLECEIVLCPPATLLPLLAMKLDNSVIGLGGQDCHTEASGAYTGDISAEMLKDAGATCVIVGHSERRAGYSETSAVVRSKAAAAHRAGLTAIVCIGESAEERQAGMTLQVVVNQLFASLPHSARADNCVIAYEPVWAIGSGQTPTLEDIATVHAHIFQALAERFQDGGLFRLLYGGSVKPSNAAALMSIDRVNGALVGGASLRAEDFLGIIGCYADR